MTGADAITDADDQYRTAVRPDERVSEAVVRLVAAVDGTDPLDLRPLGHVVDPDAINALFAPGPGRSGTTSRTVTFSYHGYTVTVDGTETDHVCFLRVP